MRSKRWFLRKEARKHWKQHKCDWLRSLLVFQDHISNEYAHRKEHYLFHMPVNLKTVGRLNCSTYTGRRKQNNRAGTGYKLLGRRDRRRTKGSLRPIATWKVQEEAFNPNPAQFTLRSTSIVHIVSPFDDTVARTALLSVRFLAFFLF